MSDQGVYSWSLFCNVKTIRLQQQLNNYEAKEAIPGGDLAKTSREASQDSLSKMLSDVGKIVAVPLSTVAESPGSFVIAVLVIILFYYLSRPINIVKDLSAVGYDSEIESGQSGRWRRKNVGDIAKELSKLRRKGKLPPIYPNGWFVLLESSEVAKGQVKHVAALGENFAVFRGQESGEVHILDAYCPHLGANIAVGGVVRGECVECPFHAWTFRGSDGQCASVPYSEKVPEFAKVKHWTSYEINNLIFVWYHAENQEPNWRPQQYTQLADWKFGGRNEYYINAHIQEIPENGADVAHLNAIHGASLLAGGDLRSTGGFLGGGSWARHVWHANWQAVTSEGQTHKALMNLRHELRLFNKFPLVSIDVKVSQIGPGYVELSMDTGIGHAVLLQSVTPVGPLLQRVVHRLYATPYMPGIICNLIILGEALMFERDVMVWNHKKFEDKPVLVSEDRAISKYRRWYSQFYSENSPRYGATNNNSLDW